MKKSIVTLLTTALTLAALVLQPVSAFASGGQTFTDVPAAPVNVPVTASISNEYVVTIPTNIEISGETKSATYSVGAKGDVSANTIITIEPAASFNMTYLLKSVTASVTQTKGKWLCADVTAGDGEGTTVNGTISAPGLTAGNWSGVLTFNIAVKDAAYIANDNSTAYTWDELVSGQYVTGAGGVIGKDTNFDSLPAGSIVFPDTVTGFSTDAFKNCTNLTSVKLPNTITSIGDGSFNGTGITSLTVPSTVATIGTDAFAGITTVYYSGSATGTPWGATTVVTN